MAVINMLPKIPGARRIRYKGEELYIMLKGNAQRVFSKVYGLEDYTDDTIVFIVGADENKHGVCASSDRYDDDDVTIMASYDDFKAGSNTQRTWEPYWFSPLHFGMACMAVIFSGITEDDHLKAARKPGISIEAQLLDFIWAAPVAYQQLEVRAAINIYNNGLSDYAEAHDDTYGETRSFREWGTGEEGPGVLNGESITSHPKPSCLGFMQKNIVHLLQAIENPDWKDVPYIKLIAENGDLQV